MGRRGASGSVRGLPCHDLAVRALDTGFAARIIGQNVQSGAGSNALGSLMNRSKPLFWTSGLTLLVLAASAVYGSAQSTRSLSVDLNGDGSLERIAWEEFATTEDQGTFLQLIVYDAGGKPLWEGPAEKDTGNPLVFGEWHFGLSLPEIAVDIDNDGATELIAPAPQSDVSPTLFRILRWVDGKFVPVRTAALIESSPGSGKFAWTEEEKWDGTWISSFIGVNGDGSVQVSVFQYEGGETVSRGRANGTVTGAGIEVREWTSPLKPVTD